MLAVDLCLKALIEKMTDKGAMRFYKSHLSYENIDILLPTEDDYEKQGICIRMSSQGLDYFVNYLSLLGLTLRQWCQRWRSLALDGYVTKCTRLDYAIDDKRVEGDEAPLLTMRKVFTCIANGEYCGRGELETNEEIRVRQHLKTIKGEKCCGKTLYIGSRKSERLIRFYDKKAEQIQKKRKVSKELTSWVRCEAEYHRSFAMCVFNAFCDNSDEDFIKFMSNSINSQFRFVNLDKNNISRCSLKRWWRAFLDGCDTQFMLKRIKPARSALARSLRGLKQYTRVINSLYQCVGLDGLYNIVSSNCDIFKAQNKDTVIDEVIKNFEENELEYKTVGAVENYTYNSNLPEDELLYKMHCERHRLYCHIGDYAVKSEAAMKDPMFSQYVNGQEFLGYDV